MRWSFAGACFALLLGTAACSGSEPSGAPRPVPSGPSVLLVSIDTLRADRVGAYGAGHAATPTLDRLAREGLLFEAAFAPTPLTLPSHASLLTGWLPPRHRVRHNGLFRLGEEAVTLAERFRDGGYATGAVLGAIVLGPRYGLVQGFGHYDARPAAGSRPSSRSGYPERTAREVTDAALGWLADRPEPERPFFLFVHYYDPHAVYRPPEPYAGRFAGRPYDGEVAYVDAELGRLLAALPDDLRIVVTSDHGESLGEHGERTHGYTLYDAALHVPLLLRGPGVPAGARIAQVVSTVDVAPTLLALAGLPPLPSPDGRNLAPMWKAQREVLASFAYAETLATRLDHGWAPIFALRSDRHLYVSAPRPELYDVRRDPAQLENLLERPSPETEEWASKYERTVAVHREAGADPADLPDPERPRLDAERRAELAALGYVLPEGAVPETGIDPKDGLPFAEALQVAEDLYRRGRPDEAAVRARALLERFPESARLHDVLARIHRDRGEPGRALVHAEQAVAAAPVAARYWKEVADLRVTLGDLPGAVRAYRNALERDPSHAGVHAGLLWQVALGADPEEMALHAEHALAVSPSDRTRLRLAEIWERVGQPERALALYEEVLARDPASPRARLGLGLLLLGQGEPGAAERALAAAGELGRSRDARLRLAIAWAARAETDRAEAILRALLERDPGDEETRGVLAVLLRRSGRPAEADALVSRERAADHHARR